MISAFCQWAIVSSNLVYFGTNCSQINKGDSFQQHGGKTFRVVECVYRSPKENMTLCKYIEVPNTKDICRIIEGLNTTSGSHLSLSGCN